MRRWGRRFIFFVALGLGVGLSTIPTLKQAAAEDAVANPVRISTGEWTPYISDSLPGGGPVLQVVREALAAEGLDADFEFTVWNRGLKLAEAGRYHASAVWGPSKDRESGFLFSDPVVESPLVFFHLKDADFDWSSYDDLAGLRVGTVLGNEYTPGFETARAADVFTAIDSPSETIALRNLFLGRVDVVPMNVVAGYGVAQKAAPDDVPRLTHHQTPLRKSSYHLLISRAAPAAESLRTRFNAGLRRLKAEGRLQALYESLGLGS